MNVWKQTPLIRSIGMALIAIAIVFSAPASHAASRHCMTETSAATAHPHSGEHHSKSKAALGDEACCPAICAMCTLIATSPDVSVSISTLRTHLPDLQDNLAGTVPLPALKPPQPAV